MSNYDSAFRCPHCRQKIAITHRSLGNRVRCGGCKHTFTVPYDQSLLDTRSLERITSTKATTEPKQTLPSWLSWLIPAVPPSRPSPLTESQWNSLRDAICSEVKKSPEISAAIKKGLDHAMTVDRDESLRVMQIMGDCVWWGFGDMAANENGRGHLNIEILKAMAENELTLVNISVDAPLDYIRDEARHLLNVLRVVRERNLIA